MEIKFFFFLKGASVNMRSPRALFSAGRFLLVAACSVVGLTVIDGAAPRSVSAVAGDGITSYVSPPFVQGPPAAFNASIETFNTWSNCSSFPASSVGTFSGTCTIADGTSSVWGGATTTSDTPTVGGTPSKYPSAPSSGNMVLTFATPAKYVGFWWSAGSAGNTVKFYTAADAVNPIATFTTTTINSILGTANPSPFPGTAKVTALNGSQYLKSYYFGRPANHTTLTPTNPTTVSSMTNKESHAFLNIYASGSIAFTKVEFTGSGFEFDNVAISDTVQTPPGSQVLIESVLGKTVDFQANGGTGTMPAQTSTSPTTLTPNTFTRAGYTFNGWYSTQSGTGGTSYVDADNYNFSANLTLWAQWTPNNLTVTYDSQGGSAIANGSTTSGGSIATSPGTPTRTGYTFNGWFAAATGGTALTFPYAHGQTADFILYAQWTAIAYKVKYDSQGGSTVADGSYTIGATITLAAAPTRTGYAFNGWFAAATGGTALAATYAPAGTGDITLYAQWGTATDSTPSLEAPRKTKPGKSVTITAKGFAPGEAVLMSVFGTSTKKWVTADENGVVRLSVKLNSNLRAKQLTALAAAGSKKASQSIEIAPTTEIPKTGDDPRTPTLTALVLCFIGIVLLRRRRLA